MVRRARGYRDHEYLLLKLRFMTANVLEEKPQGRRERKGAELKFISFFPLHPLRPCGFFLSLLVGLRQRLARNEGSPACYRMKTPARVSTKSPLSGPLWFRLRRVGTTKVDRGA